ncbi:MAG: S8 family peptidase [Bdellovibrionota bacterium]|nr:S8 family peptidase [Bdellovibrionota bacterium]
MRILFLVSCLFLSFTTIAKAPKFSKKRLIVKFRQNKVPHELNSKLRLRRLFPNVFIATGKSINAMKKILSKVDDVEYIEKDYFGSKNKFKNIKRSYSQLQFSPETDSFFKDPMAKKQWHLKPAKSFGTSIEDAYKKRSSDEKNPLIIAIVDTGIDYTHQDLKDKIWINKKEIPNNKIDDDDNGYIDDYYGINTLIRDAEGKATTDPMDTHGHGTHVSGIIGATQNNGLGVAGIADKVKLMGIRTVPGRGDEKDVDVIEAFIYAAKQGAKIINCSFGKNHNEGGKAVQEAIDFIGKEYGVLVVAASGNSRRDIDSRPVYPASFNNENLLVVASTSKGNYLSYFSNYGARNVDLAAPGSSIFSTYPGNRYASLSGTSMASPVVAGIAGEVLSRHSFLNVQDLKEALLSSVHEIESFKGKLVSSGRIDLEQALLKVESSH